jgi:hypothetical protein
MRKHLVVAAGILSAAILAGVGPATAALFDGRDCGCEASLNSNDAASGASRFGELNGAAGAGVGAVTRPDSARIQLAFTLIE